MVTTASESQYTVHVTHLLQLELSMFCDLGSGVEKATVHLFHLAPCRGKDYVHCTEMLDIEY